jgi:hypothetical protein
MTEQQAEACEQKKNEAFYLSGKSKGLHNLACNNVHGKALPGRVTMEKLTHVRRNQML